MGEKKKVSKSKKEFDPMSALNDLDKNISKALNNMSINISLSTSIPAPEKKKGGKKK